MAEFDPNKPFTTVAETEFDPSKPFTTVTPPSEGNAFTQAVDSLGAAGLSAADTAAFGYLPQIVGGAKAAFGNDYVKARDQQIKYQEDVAKAHPYATTAGTIAGIAAPMAVGVGELQALNAFRGETLAAKAGIAGLKGAAYGAAFNPGDKAGEVSPLQLQDRALNGAVGIPFGVAGEGLAKAVEKLPSTMKTARRYFTAKELGANTSQMKQLIRELPGGGPEPQLRLDQMEAFLDKNGLLNSGKNFSDIHEASKQIRNQTGQRIGQVYDQVQNEIGAQAQKSPEILSKLDETALHGPDLVNEFMAGESKRLSKIHGGNAVESTLRSRLGTPDTPVDLTGFGRDIKLQDLVNYRASVDDSINWAKKSAERGAEEQSLVNLRNFLNDKIEGRISQLDEVVGSNSTKELKALNRDYSDASLAAKITENTKAREMAKLPAGLIGSVAGAGYAYHGAQNGENPVEAIAKGAAIGLGSRAARIYGPGMAYSATKALQPYIKPLANSAKQNFRGTMLLESPWRELRKENGD